MKRVDVAVGVLQGTAGRVLLACRPPGTPLAGYLEFPGGKLEPGERPEQALVRELCEEIGVAVEPGGFRPLIRIEHDYPGCTVRLHAYQVARWRGEPAGREGQALAWHRPPELSGLRLLPANRALVNALSLPGLLRMTPLLSGASAPAFADTLEQMLAEGGAGGLVIRIADIPALETLQSRLGPLAVDPARPLILNAGDVRGLPDGFSGLHLPARILPLLELRPETPGWIGASVHDEEEARRAGKLGLDYIVVGNVAETRSHPGRPALGWARFSEIALAAGLPAYAVGGMAPDDLARAHAHWGQGVAGIRAFWPEAA